MRIAIAGAGLTGLRAAEALRDEGFTGELTLLGDERHAPYDRPPLSKSVLTGWFGTDHTVLPQLRELDANWLLGSPAAGLDMAGHAVILADGQRVEWDRLLIATGTRARAWPSTTQAQLDGVFSLHSRDDADRLRQALADRPRRVLIIGGGFTGSEIASSCRELDLPVTVAERGAAPLVGALGETAGAVTADLQRTAGVDLRTRTTVLALEADGNGRLSRARLSDGDCLDVDVAVVALGAVRNVEWLAGSDLAADYRGVVCDAACRAFDADGMVTDDVFVAGDIARFPHALYEGQLLELEHWGNAVAQARTAAHNIVCSASDRRPHRDLPAFWSNQFGMNIKSVGLPTVGDEIVLTQGSLPSRRFVAAYGRAGRTVAAVAVNTPRWLDAYVALIEAAAEFPPRIGVIDSPTQLRPVGAGFPPVGAAGYSAHAHASGPGPASPPSQQESAAAGDDPREPPHDVAQPAGIPEHALAQTQAASDRAGTGTATHRGESG